MINNNMPQSDQQKTGLNQAEMRMIMEALNQDAKVEQAR
ncbi:MAG: hypothetical protein ACI8WB_005645 [Phenylobacterium sp.]|jgi:hypothetical protein